MEVQVDPAQGNLEVHPASFSELVVYKIRRKAFWDAGCSPLKQG
jgi:hypothetical protein